MGQPRETGTCAFCYTIRCMAKCRCLGRSPAKMSPFAPAAVRRHAVDRQHIARPKRKVGRCRSAVPDRKGKTWTRGSGLRPRSQENSWCRARWSGPRQRPPRLTASACATDLFPLCRRRPVHVKPPVQAGFAETSVCPPPWRRPRPPSRCWPCASTVRPGHPVGVHPPGRVLSEQHWPLVNDVAGLKTAIGAL